MKKALIVSATLAAFAGGALAQDYSGHLKARQGQFRIMAINLGMLGAMAKGEAEYDAAKAQAAADSIVAVTMINQAPLWPEGSDSMSMDGTRAKPGIWDNLPDLQKKWGDLGTAAKAMQAAAGTDAQAIGGAMGALGGACKACHDEYREPQT